MSCQIPSDVHVRSTINVRSFTCIIHSCQISSIVCKQLMSTKAPNEQPDRMLEIVTRFDRQLRLWKESLSSQLRPKDHLKEFQTPSKTMFLSIVLIHCSYYDLLMVIHTFFTYPWITNSISPNLKPQLRAKLDTQIITSSNAAVDAARNIIVISRHFEINGACTHAYTSPWSLPNCWYPADKSNTVSYCTTPCTPSSTCSSMLYASQGLTPCGQI